MTKKIVRLGMVIHGLVLVFWCIYLIDTQTSRGDIPYHGQRMQNVLDFRGELQEVIEHTVLVGRSRHASRSFTSTWMTLLHCSCMRRVWCGLWRAQVLPLNTRITSFSSISLPRILDCILHYPGIPPFELQDRELLE